MEHVAGQDRAEAGGDVGIVVEAQDGVRLGQGLGEVLAVALREAAHRDHGPGVPTLLEVGSGEQGVDGVLLGGLDETAGVAHDRVGVLGVVDEPEAVGGPAGELLGVDVVAGAPEGHQGDRDVSVRGHRRRVCRPDAVHTDSSPGRAASPPYDVGRGGRPTRRPHAPAALACHLYPYCPVGRLDPDRRGHLEAVLLPEG